MNGVTLLEIHDWHRRQQASDDAVSGNVSMHGRMADTIAATLRQQAGMVDEGMVERAIAAYSEVVPEDCMGLVRKKAMRAALTAALAQNTQGDGETVANDELPGMWSNSDFTGGDPDERSHAERARVPTIPPEAVPVGEASLLPGVATKDWAIQTSPCCTRVVDERMAYGWNECRKAMLAAAPSQRAEVK